MSNRTYVCLECRTAKRAEVAWGLVTDYRCRLCRKPLAELAWERRVPARTDDKGWKELRAVIFKSELEWTPRRTRIGMDRIRKIDAQIVTEASRAYVRNRKRDRLKKLQKERDSIEKKYNLRSPSKIPLIP